MRKSKQILKRMRNIAKHSNFMTYGGWSELRKSGTRRMKVGLIECSNSNRLMLEHDARENGFIIDRYVIDPARPRTYLVATILESENI